MSVTDYFLLMLALIVLFDHDDMQKTFDEWAAVPAQISALSTECRAR
jgi:hypothetical protein